MAVQVLILPNGPGTGISFWEIPMGKFGAGKLPFKLFLNFVRHGFAIESPNHLSL
jgi:hypothetical protein